VVSKHKYALDVYHLFTGKRFLSPKQWGWLREKLNYLPDCGVLKPQFAKINGATYFRFVLPDGLWVIIKEQDDGGALMHSGAKEFAPQRKWYYIHREHIETQSK